MFDFDENLIRITEYEVLGTLPDPFLSENGSRLTDPAQWPARRAELYRTAVELQYGTQPPKPEVFSAERTYIGKNAESLRITAGTAAKQVTFSVKILRPAGVDTPAAVVDGDLCFNYAFDRDYLAPFFSRGIAYVTFDRTMLADDLRHRGRRKGALYHVYPEYTFGALGAWAWGYARCVDALEQLGGYDLSALAFTGHSRGGKTAMLAGVLDERAKIVNPNDTNAGSCSCYRIHTRALTEDGEERRSETLRDLWDRFDFWLGEGMEPYIEREAELPFDCHFLKAMVAPRILLIGEAASDIWTNPVGSWQTSEAAAEVFRFLGVPQNLLWYFRRGYHQHHRADADTLAQVIDHVRTGAPLPDRFFRTPFRRPERSFAWKCPE